MSTLPPGIYFVASRTVTPESALAVTFNGIGAPLTVVDFGSTPNTLWNISDYDGTAQYISPLTNGTLQVAQGEDNSLKAIPGTDFVWSIVNNNGEYTVEDSNKKLYWYLAEAKSEEPVTLIAEGAHRAEQWAFKGTQVIGTDKWLFLPVVLYNS